MLFTPVRLALFEPVLSALLENPPYSSGWQHKETHKRRPKKCKMQSESGKHITELDMIFKRLYEGNIYYKGIGILGMSKVFDGRQK